LEKKMLKRGITQGLSLLLVKEYDRERIATCLSLLRISKKKAQQVTNEAVLKNSCYPILSLREEEKDTL
jgi:hypothetical protein